MSAVAKKFPPLLVFALTTGLVLFTGARSLFGQTTVGTGNIIGTVSDPSGAVIRRAKVAITNIATQQPVNVTTNSSGSFNSGALIPGGYRASVSAEGFSSTEVSLTPPLFKA